MIYYVLMEQVMDPREDRPVGVYSSREEVETAQLEQQQTKARDYNGHRQAAFLEGCGFQERRTADSFAHHFQIKEVTQ